MVDGFYDLLRLLGSGICHQRLELTFFSNGIYMPVCSRCAGMYIGFFLSLVLIFIIDRKIKVSTPSIKHLSILVSSFFFMGLDVVLTTYSVIDANNLLRFFTGFIAGWSLALIILQLANLVLFKKAIKKHYLDKKISFIIWVFAGVIFISLFFISYKKLIYFWSVISITGIILFYANILLILIFASIKRISNSIKTVRSFTIIIFLAVLASTSYLLLSGFVRGII